MNSAGQTTDPSILLWLVAAVVALLTGPVALGWLQAARRHASLRERWPGLLIASAVLGVGVNATMLVGIAAQGLLFPLGYRYWAAPVLVLGGVIAAVPLALWLSLVRRGWMLMLGGAGLACLAAAVELGWLWAAGFRPGIVIAPEWATAAALTLILTWAAVPWLAFSSISQESERPAAWRFGASALLGGGLIAGQELLMLATGVAGQQGSIYLKELSATVMALFAGVLVPLVLGLLAVDLLMRRPLRRRHGQGSFNPQQGQRRRKRRHRVRTL